MSRIWGLPKLIGRKWDEVAKELYEFLSHLEASDQPSSGSGVNFTAAGDIAVGISDNGNISTDTLPIGTNNHVLSVNTGLPNKVSWRGVLTLLYNYMTSKGDILASTGSAVGVVSLPGASARILQSALGEATGIKWSGSGFENRGDMLTFDGTDIVKVPRAEDHVGGYANGGWPKVLRAGAQWGSGFINWDDPWNPWLYTTVMVHNTATDIMYFALAAGAAHGAVLRYQINVTSGNDVQCETGELRFSAVRTGAGGAAVVETPVKIDSGQALTSGTLTATWALADDAGNDRIALTLNCNSSLGTPSYELIFDFVTVGWGDVVFNFDIQ